MRYLRFLILVLVVFSTVSVGTVWAQQDEIITYGNTLTGRIRAVDEPVVYVFEAAAGDVINVSTQSDTIDTVVAVATENGDILAEHDDISQTNLNASLDFTVPTNGVYLIGVWGYDKGSFDVTLTLVTESGAQNAEDEVLDGEQVGDAYTGSISEQEPFVEISIPDVPEGATILIDVRATSGDLDLYAALFFGDTVLTENDDREEGILDSLIEYPNAEAGDYVVLITRYGFEEGATEGNFEAAIQVAADFTGLVTSAPAEVLPAVSGYPRDNPAPRAEWTILAYMGADNNLESGLLNDLNEFELAGGSSEDVRVIALVDRSGEYDVSNEDWTEVRVFEVGADESRDQFFSYPPTVDSQALFELGELDTSYGDNLLNFLVWGMRNYPANHYAVSLSDHGGAWSGIVTDDTTGYGEILSITELQQVFSAALEATGVEKFDLLVNDACLMSSVEYYATISPYFDYVYSSPEITLDPSLDMTLLTNTLKKNPDIDLGVLGQMIVDKYLADMTALSPSDAPLLGAAVTDLRGFGQVVDAINGFTSIINENPQAYISLLGRARANTYAYSFFMPEEEYGPATNIDLGSLMHQVIALSPNPALSSAAEDVLSALDSVLIYGDAGADLAPETSFYNVYFPARSSDFNTGFLREAPIEGWVEMLRGYYGGTSPRASRAVGSTPAAAPSSIPEVTITNVYPQETSILLPVVVSMEVVGRNIATGNFTVDHTLPDGRIQRLDRSGIVFTVVEDGQVNYVEAWESGVNETDFTWDVMLTRVTDGTTSSFEMVAMEDDVASIAGRYHYPDADEWVEVVILFDDEGNATSVLSSQPGSTAVANVRLTAGGEFQVFRSIVTADGRIEREPGTIFQWTDEGISFDYAPAPSGEYNLGFFIEAFGGATGFASVPVRVNNEGLDGASRGYLDLDWGFNLQYPRDWYEPVYFPENDYIEAESPENNAFIYVYAVEGETAIKEIAQNVLDRYELASEGFTPITVDGREALEFTYTYSYASAPDVTYTAHAFAVYMPELELGLVFSADTIDGQADNTAVYEMMLAGVSLFDSGVVREADIGVWTSDFLDEFTRYPVRQDWMPGRDINLWWEYTPDNADDSVERARFTVYVDVEDGSALLTEVLDEEGATLANFESSVEAVYYGQNRTWENASFTFTLEDGTEIRGRIYVTVENGTAYVLWFQAPADAATDLFRLVYDPMLDGFKVMAEEAAAE